MSSTSECDVKLFDSFLKIGCCQTCCLRLLGESNPAIYQNVTQHVKHVAVNSEDENHKYKVKKDNPCIGCLGLLQNPFEDAVLEKVLSEIEQFTYDSPTFSVALVFPVSMQLRAHSLFLYLEKNYPEHCANVNPHARAISVGVKEVWKWRCITQIKNNFSSEKKFTACSPLTVTIKMKYADEDKECSALFKMLPNDFSKTKNRKNQGSVDVYSRKSVEKALETVGDSIFKTHFLSPPEIPSEPMICEEVTACYNSIHIAGRYNKWSRELPQTPWIIDGKRRMESSVQEIITEPLLKLTSAQDARFSSSGREDVDVRTLGRGRPFSVELIDPKKTIFTNEEMRKTEQQINELGNNKVTIRDLQIVGKECLNLLKDGEEMKTKDYNALCVLLGRVDSQNNPKEYCIEDCLQKINSIQTPLVIDQATPVRVLHRRALAIRQKTIHTMSGTKISESQFVLHLQTQAGTYIKEFIHGDLGRTSPSLGELLEGYQVDILALDVQDISLDWPPP
uniref:tRNA pseudouridine(55) synthase n=1 Tax=Rhodnius prolixus TaxID=13249 RepID=T1IET3_RHOPR